MKFLSSFLIAVLLTQSAFAASTGTAYQVMRVPSPAGTGVAKPGSIDLSQSAAVGSSILGKANGGTGLSSAGSAGNILGSDGTDFVSQALNVAGMFRNIGAVMTVGSSALTMTVKQADGATNCSATAPCMVAFRSSTSTTGSVVVRSITGALAVVVPSTATLGTRSAKAHRQFLYLQDNAGTVQACASSNASIDETAQVVSTTISSGATDPSVLYCTTGATGPVRKLAVGISTQATAGTWALAPDPVVLAPFFKLPSDARVFVHTGNGFGGSSSGETKIRNFTTTEAYEGTAITYTARTTTAGDKFVINEFGNYTYCVNDNNNSSGNGFYGASVDGSALSTSIADSGAAIQTYAQGRRLVGRCYGSTGGSQCVELCRTENLIPGQVVRAHGDASFETSNVWARWSIVKNW